MRSVVQLLHEQLDEAGGITSILPFSQSSRGDEPVYSCPINSNAMLSYEDSHQLGRRIVAVDLFTDGTTLAKSGSQSANAMCVRFVNLDGAQNLWHEIGIEPTLHTGGNRQTESEKKRMRLEMFQRFCSWYSRISSRRHGMGFYTTEQFYSLPSLGDGGCRPAARKGFILPKSSR